MQTQGVVEHRSLPPLDDGFRVPTPRRLPQSLEDIDYIELLSRKEEYSAFVISLDGQLSDRKQSVDEDNIHYRDWRRRTLRFKSLSTLNLNRLKSEITRRRAVRNDMLQTMRDMLEKAQSTMLDGTDEELETAANKIIDFLHNNPAGSNGGKNGHG